ncbi:MAG: cell division protein PerM, partial [Stackebrandtia sp.]
PPRRRDSATAGVRGAQRQTVPVNPRRGNRLRGVLVAGLVTSVWNCLVVILPVFMLVMVAWWIAGHPGSVSDVARTAGAVWLLAHGIPVSVSGLAIGIPPLALTAVLVWRLARAGAHTIRAIGGRDFPAIRATTLSVLIGYILVATLVGYLVDGSLFAVTGWKIVVHAAVLAIVASSLGALGESGLGHHLWHRFPIHIRRGMRTGMLSTVTLLAAGCLLVGAALAVRGGLVIDSLAAYSGGAIGLGILSLLFMPTVSVWAASYLLGPGFAVGVDTHVGITTVDIMPLPVFPLFAAIPDAPLPAAGTALLGVPLAIGTLHGVLLAIRSIDLRVARLIWAGLTAGVTSAVLVAVAGYLSSGPLGNGQLASIGPHVLRTASVSGGMIGGSVLVAALLARMLGARHRPQYRPTRR